MALAFLTIHARPVRRPKWQPVGGSPCALYRNISLGIRSKARSHSDYESEASIYMAYSIGASVVQEEIAAGT
jgi:hypothetical protein